MNRPPVHGRADLPLSLWFIPDRLLGSVPRLRCGTLAAAAVSIFNYEDKIEIFISP